MDDPLYTANTNGILNTKTGLKDETLREGYIYVQPSPKVEGKGWIDKYYLYCVPTEQLLLNKNLTQTRDGLRLMNSLYRSRSNLTDGVLFRLLLVTRLIFSITVAQHTLNPHFLVTLPGK